MKRIKHTTIIILAVLMVVAGSCTKDFDEMNVNPNAATEVPATNVFGRAILDATYIVLGERLDIYYAGTWAGHTVHIGIGDYEYRVDINNSQWRSFYSAMAYFVDAMKLAEAEENDNLYAASLMMKAYLAHKASDCWGKIPYSEAFILEEDVLYPKYDTEEEIYNQVLQELETAADMFDPDGPAMGEGDFLLAGDIDKWIRFCNSTRLRVATRMTAGNETAGRAVISAILGSPAANPLIESNDQNAYLWWPGITPDIELWWRRTGAPDGNKTTAYRTSDYLISALKDNNDPRLPVYADPNKYGEFNGYKFGPDQSIDTMNNGNNVSHIGDRFGNDVAGFSPYFNAAEVEFLKAEAYERGWVTGDAQAAYEAGITKSLEENGIDADAISTFLAEPEVAWGGGTTSNLEKIYLQKWLSLYKQSVEAWAEARRTDVPLMPNVEKNYSGAHNRPPFRMSYADEEKSLNTNFPFEVVETDIFWGTQMWWDKRTGVQ
jgi:hypothetical protein